MRLRAMGVGDVLDETFRLYRRHFLSFVIATAVVAVPTAFLSTALNLAVGAGVSRGQIDTPDDLAGVIFVAGAVGFVSSLGYLLSATAVIRLASGAILGTPLDVGGAYRGSLGRIWPLLGSSFLGGLAVALLVLTCIGAPVGIYFGAGWAVSSQAVVLERLGPIAGLRRSGALVDGHRWRVLGSAVAISLLVWLLISVPAGLVGLLVGAVAAFGDPASFGLRALAEVANAFVSAIGQSLFGSLAWITTTIVYYELRVRKEAFDLEQLAERAERAPPPPLSAESVPPPLSAE